MSYAHGTFNWVDLVAKDIERVRPFYQELFGWSYAEQPGYGGPPYGIFSLGGQTAAGIGQMSDEMVKAGTPSTWNTYVSVDDIAAVESKVAAHGGSLMFDTITIPNTGKTNWAKDPEGAVFALWEADGHIGSEVTNVPGGFCWNELATRDLALFEKFYGAVFDWTFEREKSPTSELSMIRNGDGREQGHALRMTEEWGDMPPAWSVYFSVADCDASVERIRKLDGRLNFGPIDIPAGRFAHVSDPDGAHFYVIRLTTPLSG